MVKIMKLNISIGGWRIFAGLLFTLLIGCAATYNPLDDFKEVKPSSIQKAPADAGKPSAGYSKEQVAQGKYIVDLLGCGTCHTDGALVGEYNPERYLAGSNVGIAYTNPLMQKNPGVLYPPNLTPDPATGIGNWSDEQLEMMIRTGMDRQGHRELPVMPWPVYQKIKDEDVRAIVAYLRSLKPVKHQVPENVKPGRKTASEYVYFGIYQDRE